MKNLLPISKLYNFNAKVFKNLSLTFILTFFTSLIFFSINVEASKVKKVIVDGTSYPVFYIGTKTGEGTILGHEVSANICYYNGVKNNDGVLVAYNSTSSKFTTVYQGAISPIPNGSPAAKALAQKGFCVGIKECKATSSSSVGGLSPTQFTFSEDSSGRVTYEYFSAQGGFQQLVRCNNASMTSPVVYRAVFSRNATLCPEDIQSRPVSIDQCSQFKNSKGSLQWLDEDGRFFEYCHLALQANGVSNERDAKEKCAKFACIEQPDVRTDVINPDPIRDSSPTAEGSCAWLGTTTDCILENDSSCMFDTDSATPAVNCASENKTLNTSSLGITDPAYQNKKLFCSSSNQLVMCDNAVASYAQAFPGGGGLDSRCTAYTRPTENCRIFSTRERCTFGDASTSNNCYDSETTVRYNPSGGGSSMNLFCSRDGITIACENSINTYAEVWTTASSADDVTSSSANPGSCQPFSPGMEEITGPPEQECEENEEGQVFAVGAGGATTRTVFDRVAYRSCIASSRGEAARESCLRTVLGSGNNAFQCACDVAYNPGYDFFMCSINYNEDDCSPVCALLPTTIGEILEVKTQRALNPLGLIKTVSDFLFAIAVLIFIVNMLRGSFIYVTSGGEEAKMKEAQTTITNTIFGMVFIVFIGALLRWIITIATTATTATP